MTYAAVASLSHTINLILSHHQHLLSPPLENQITSLQEHVIFLRSFLEDSPVEVRAWEEKRMRELLNEAEDIVELLLSDSFIKGKYQLHHNLDDLERVAKEIESMAKEVRERGRETVWSWDEELMKVIDRLCGGPPGLQLISIAGIGGIGKTTLARAVYNHPLIVKHFERRCWVTVSQNYSWERVVNQLFDEDFCDDLLDLYCDDLLDIRYLIVLDDLWSVEVWDRLESEIPFNKNGSRILITTRQSEVAISAGFYTPIHEMRSMNVDQSWNLLQQKIFNGEACPPELEYLGKMIAGRCRGVPLAIEVVSGILSADLTVVVWKDIAEDIKTRTAIDDEEHVIEIIHLSYSYLPHHLRPCLLYLGMFPEDHEIRVSKLVKLWEAEGFVSESEYQSIEESGEEWLEDLVKRHLVLAKKRRWNGRRKSVSVHDMVREFCVRQAKVDYFFHHIRRNGDVIQLERRVSIFDHHILQHVDASLLRTIIRWEGSVEGLQESLGYSRFLRIIDSSNAHVLYPSNLPDELFELFHLRYLALINLSHIPKAVSKLENLQTLIIHGISSVCLPVEIWRLGQLRHLIAFRFKLPSQLQEEEETSALENLQTLSVAEDLNCSRLNLELIPNLKKLGICIWEEKDSELHNLVHLQKLEILKIYSETSVKMMKPVFPRTLKTLCLESVKLCWDDMKIVGSLPNLRKLKLKGRACVGSKWETDGGGFCELMYLMISWSDLKDWVTKSSHFPTLKSLVLHHCWRLREIPIDLGATLDLIELKGDCTFSLRNSAIQIQKSLGNHSLQLRILEAFPT